MARETESLRTVTNVVAKPTDQMAADIAHMGDMIIEHNQEAKITENFSKAQLDIQRLTEQYKIDYEHDPLAGMDKLATARQQILDGYGNQISPMFRGAWNENAKDLAVKHDATTEAWGYGQTKINTVKSINSTIKNNLSQAAIDGTNFGTGSSEEIGSMLNYAESKQRLIAFGDKNLGQTTTTDLLDNYDGDYLKSFISGVSDTNPLKALRLMEKDEVKSSFKDKGQYLSMKKAVETRAMAVDKIKGEQEVLGILKDENSLLTQSIDKPMSYMDLQLAFDANPKISTEAKAFFMRANGYENRGGKLTQSEQLQNKAQLYNDMTELSKNPNLTSADISKFQERVYAGMNNGTLNEKEGATYLNGVVAPMIAQKEANNSKFSDNHWISPDIGFAGMEKLYKDNVEITSLMPLGEVSKAINNSNKVKMYDYYMTALQQQAASYGKQLSDIGSLNTVQQRKLYGDAQAEAYKMFQVDRNPVLSTLPDLPNQTFTGGKLIQGAAGDRALKPDVTVAPKFETYVGDDGYMYRKYPDGKYERVGSAPKGLK